MGLFAWREEYSIGFVEIDQQHKRLFSLAEELHSAMSTGKGKDVLYPILKNLTAYTRAHFAAEEKLMRLHEYPAFALHKAEHDALTQKVLRFQADFQAGRVAMTVDLMHFLREWLVHHIGDRDCKVGAYLKSEAVA